MLDGESAKRGCGGDFLFSELLPEDFFEARSCAWDLVADYGRPRTCLGALLTVLYARVSSGGRRNERPMTSYLSRGSLYFERISCLSRGCSIAGTRILVSCSVQLMVLFFSKGRV